MTSRERFYTICGHKEADRPCFSIKTRADYGEGLVKFLGLKDAAEMFQLLETDFRQTVRVSECDKKFDAEKVTGVLGGSSESSGGRFLIYEDGSYEDLWGVVKKMGDDQLYERWIRGPFTETADINKYDWPGLSILESVDSVRAKVDKASGGGNYAVFGRLWNPYYKAWLMRGFQEILCDMYDNPDFVHELIERCAVYETEKGVRLAKAGADMIGLGGDFTSGKSLLMSVEHFREFLLPSLAKMVAAFKAANPKVKCLIHSDGNLEPAFDDLIDIGFDVFDPIQPECMDVPSIKKRYGSRIVMHGMIPVQSFMQDATPGEVKKYIRNLADTVCAGGGAVLCNSNQVQWDIPFENVVAVYEELLQKKILK